MKTAWLAGISILGLLASGPAGAADMAIPTAPPRVPTGSWTGVYGGLHSGAAFGRAKYADPYGSALFGDEVSTPAYLFGGQLGYNFDAGSLVYGVEVDADWMSSDATNTCFAAASLTGFPGDFLSSTCRVRPDFVGTATGRLGYAIGPDGRTLLYGKAGVAMLHERGNITRNYDSGNSLFGAEVTTSSIRGGWTAGIGIEQAVAPAWSWKFEYDYMRFSGAPSATPASFTFNRFAVTPVAPRATSVEQDFHAFKVGVNYKLGGDPWSTWSPASAAAALPVKAAPARGAGWAPGWDFAAGGRYWFSFGRFQKNIGLFTTARTPVDTNISRLTYDDMRTRNGELFGRIDSPYKIFLKGLVGGGRGVSGKMNDEDWFDFIAATYSNTISSPVLGNATYATVDVGYTWLRGPTFKSGVFVGYNYFREEMRAYGCAELAGPLTCIPPVANVGGAIITEADTWQSVRIGSGGEISLGALRLSAEAAYLPYVRFRGEDNHLFGNTGIIAEIFPESGRGRGAQLEAMVNYDVTQNFSVGMGGRYWAMWTRTGEFNCSFGAAGLCPGAPTPPQHFKAATEQAGMLIQASYKFGVPPAVPVAAKDYRTSRWN